MRSVSGVLTVCLVLASTAAFSACPNRPNALGTSRVMSVDPAKIARIGTIQYPQTLPLADREVVLTFDDGPLPPYTNHILDVLASECVKATFFVVGRMARSSPELVRRAYNEGHTIATHTQTHPYLFSDLPIAREEREVEEGIASIEAALGDAKALAPFFRFPGFRRSNSMENYLAGRGLMVWSADIPSDDWRHISPRQVIDRTLRRLEHKGKGVILMHDIQPATALALPILLRALKAEGYRIVHVVPTVSDRPATVAPPDQWVDASPQPTWPRTAGPAALHPPAVDVVHAKGDPSQSIEFAGP